MNKKNIITTLFKVESERLKNDLLKKLSEKKDIWDGGVFWCRYQSNPTDFFQNGKYFEKFVWNIIMELFDNKSYSGGDCKSCNPRYPHLVCAKEPYGDNTFPDFAISVSEDGESTDWSLDGTTPAIAIDAKSTARKGSSKGTSINLGSANSFGKVNRNRFSEFYLLVGVYSPIWNDHSIIVDMMEGVNGYKIKPTIQDQRFLFVEESQTFSLTLAGKDAKTVNYINVDCLNSSKWYPAKILLPETMELFMEFTSATLKKLPKSSALYEATKAFIKFYKKPLKNIKKDETKKKYLWKLIMEFAKGSFEAYIVEQEILGFHSYENLWEEIRAVAKELCEEERVITDKEIKRLDQYFREWKKRDEQGYPNLSIALC